MTEAAVTVSGTAPARIRVTGIELEGDGCLVRLDHGTSRRFPIDPDLEAARRWLRTMRRVVLVEIDLAGRRRCWVSGVGHRQLVTRTVSLATALGLGALGVPLTLRVTTAEGHR